MKTLFLAIAAGALLLSPADMSAAQDAPAVGATPVATSAGISLDSPWRRAVYAQATDHFQHPGWGWRHSGRNYVLGMELADGLTVDADVLFAAAFLHDWGGIEPFAVAGVDHAARSIELAPSPS